MWRKIIYKTSKQLNNLRTSWKYLTELLYLIYENANVWVSGNDLEEIAENFMKKNNIKWAFKWYNNFPANLCFSVNECVVHWRPSDYILKEWDLLKIDAGVIYEKAISDAAWSKIIWWNKHNIAWYELIKTTKKALDAWIETLKVGESFYNLGKTVFNTMEKWWFSVIRNLTWHGVWVKLHEDPFIYNYPNKELKQTILKNNMSFAVEPITAENSKDFIEESPWSWELICENKDLWAQWEYTCIAENNKIEIVAWIQENLFDK